MSRAQRIILATIAIILLIGSFSVIYVVTLPSVIVPNTAVTFAPNTRIPQTPPPRTPLSAELNLPLSIPATPLPSQR